MPQILEPGGMPLHHQGSGWRTITLADRDSLAAGSSGAAMVARRWSLLPGAQTDWIEHGDNEEILYVIHGAGQMMVGEQRFDLAAESLVWLEPGDRYRLAAADTGLEVLQSYAPGN